MVVEILKSQQCDPFTDSKISRKLTFENLWQALMATDEVYADFQQWVVKQTIDVERYL